MKIFTNKKLWKKLIIIVLVIMVFNVFTPKKVHAGSVPGDTLLEPVTNLFANLGDGLMEIMQKTFMGMESSGTWVEEESNLWLKILVIAAAVAVATLAVASIVLSGGAALAIVASIVGAVIKIGIGTAIAYFAVSTLKFGSKGFYLPEYHLTLQSIFSDEILAFDVDFFNPKPPKEKPKEQDENENIDGYGEDFRDNMLNVVARQLGQEDYDKFKETYHVGSTFANYSDEHQKTSENPTGKTHDSDKFILSGNVASGGNMVLMHQYTWKYKNKTYTVYYGYNWRNGNNYYLSDLKIKKEGNDNDKDYSPAQILQPTVAAWYKAFRNIALVALLSILVYVGIRIILSSTADDKAKYKQMLIDWVVALCLVFLMHYIMSFAVTLNKKIIDVVGSIKVASYGSQDDITGGANQKKKVGNTDTSNVKTEETNNVLKEYKGKEPPDTVDKVNDVGVQLFVIEDHEAAERAYKVLVDDGSTSSNGKGKNSSFYNRFKGTGSSDRVLYWPANDFMEQARLLGQNVGDNETQSSVERAGYNIIYVVLVIYTIIFCFTYLKRVVYMALLTIISPLVAITYPIDKMNDGKAQAFNMWLKEYIFNLLIQPMHLILYTVLIGSAMKFASINIFYTVVALGFLLPAEKLLRSFFGFEKAKTPGAFEGAAGTALMMTGINNIMNRGKQGALDSGKDEEKSENQDGKIKTPAMNKKIDNVNGLFNSNYDEQDLNDLRLSDSDIFGNGNITSNSSNNYTSGLGNRQIGSLKNQKITAAQSNKYPSKPNSNRNSLGGGSNTSLPGNRIVLQSNSIPINQAKNKRSIRRALAAGLRARGRKTNKYYGLSGSQAAIRFAKQGLGAGAKVGGAVLGASAAGLASIAGGDPQKAIRNMAIAGASGYAAGKGVSNKIENASIKEELNAAKEGYYGQDYEKKQQKKFEKEFAKNEENLKKIQKRMNVERKDAKRIAEEVAKNTKIKGIDNIDQALAMYRMKKEGKYTAKEIEYAASYSEVALGGKNTKHMADRKKHQKALKDSFVNNGEDEKKAEVKAENMFRAIDRYNELKN